ncbi:MAG: L-2-amino-thiazoline-4-carboxylic acid hydrolase [Promethearchaeota archaeon]
MDDLEKEKQDGLSLGYLMGAIPKRALAGKKYQTPGFGIGAQLFATMSKHIIEKLGPEEGELLIKTAVEEFGQTRGKRIAEKVTGLGKSLSLKNWLIHTDINSSNMQAKTKFEDGDLIANVGGCTFIEAAQDWGLEDYAKIYCKYVDCAIMEGYNPDILLKVNTRHETGKKFCRFQYVVKKEK